MAADTPQKRYSAYDWGLPWRSLRVIPTGTVGASQRLALLGLYSFGEQAAVQVGLAVETDSSIALSRRKFRAVGLSTESDSAISLTRRRITNVGLATEADSSITLSRRKARAAGISTEANSSLPLSRIKAKAAGLGTETDASLALSRRKSKATALGSETDTALALSATVAGTYGVAAETDTSIALSKRKGRAVGFAVETDSSLAQSKVKSKSTAISIEVDTAFALVPATTAIQRPVGLASETDTSYLPDRRVKIRKIGFAGGWGLSSGVFQLSQRFTDLWRIARFSSDGSKILTIATAAESGSYRITKYLCGTAWDVNTAVPVQIGTISRSGAFFVSSDGTKILLAWNEDTPSRKGWVSQYSMSTGWDLSTLQDDNSSYAMLPDMGNGSIDSFFVNESGTTIYVAGGQGVYYLYKYTLSNPWTVNSIGLSQRRTTSGISPAIAWVNSAATKAYSFLQNSALYVTEYTFGTAGNINTLSTGPFYAPGNRSGWVGGGIYNQFFNPEGTTLYVFGEANSLTARTYTIHDLTAWTLSTAALRNVSTYKDAALTTKAGVEAFHITSDGTYIYGSFAGNINLYKLLTPWNLSTCCKLPAIADIAYLFGGSRLVTAIRSNPENTRIFFVCSDVSGTPGQLNLAAPYDLSSGSTLSGATVTAGNALYIREDGLKAFHIGTTQLNVARFTTARWSTSTWTFDSGQTLTYGTGGPTEGVGVYFRNDGRKYLVLGTGNDRVGEYNLTTAWSFTGGSFSGNILNIGSQTTSPTDLFVNPDGDLMYISDFNFIYQYSIQPQTDFAFALGRKKIRNILLGLETDEAFALEQAISSILVGQADEIDIAYALDLIETIPVLSAVETDLAFALERVKVRSTDFAVETDLAYSSTITKIYAYGFASETDVAIFTQQLRVGMAIEYDTQLVLFLPDWATSCCKDRRLWQRFEA